MLFTSRRDLALVKALAEHRHFGRAAAALGISQPAVSRSLAVLESAVGGPLFDRSTMHPTEMGRIVLRAGDRIVSGFVDLEREIALLKGLEVGELAVAMGPYPAAISGQRAVAHLSRAHPKLHVDLRIMDWTHAIEATVAGTVDLAFADLQDARSHADLEVRPVRRQAMSFVYRSGHPLTRKEGITLHDLLDFPWVGPVLPSRIGTNLPGGEKVFGSYDMARQRFRTRITVETFPAMIEVALDSDSIAGALPFQVAAEVEAGLLCVLELPAPFLTLDYGIILRRGRTPSPAANALMRAIADVERQRPSPP